MNGAATPSFTVKSYIDLSKAEEEGKFVLLTKGKALHLILSPLSLTPYHANIIYQYLQVEGRGKVEATSSGGCKILSKAWQVHGGGHYTAQPWLHHLSLHGKSTAFGKYDRGLLEPHADEVCPLLGLSGYTLEFG
jgi:hypothetical protein